MIPAAKRRPLGARAAGWVATASAARTAGLCSAVVALLGLLLPGPVHAEGRRIAVVIANNFGGPRDPPLEFARRDALRIAQTFTELGFVAQSDLLLVLDGTAAEARAALEEAERRAGSSDAAMLLVYYSGHADGDALHLGGTTLGWSELRERMKASDAGLRLVIVDACQAGSLIAAKGLVAVRGSTLAAEPKHRGTAFFMATESSELAQEAPALGGSFFTHYLVSGLRGAADANADGVITLAEAQSYATNETTRATATWARAAQHPNYDFEFTGHGDVVLTSLREASAVLVLDRGLEGHVAITETGSPLALIELDKRPGMPLPLALPNGRYVVHIRGEDAVWLAEVVLPWGGTRLLAADELSMRSYQTVSQKGGLVEVYGNRLGLGLSLQSSIARGMGVLPVLHLSYGRRLGPFEIGARIIGSRSRLQSVDTSVETTAIGGGLVFAYERPLGLVDLRGWFVAEAQLWRQEIALAAARSSGIAGAGVGAGLRVPLWNQVFAELDVETITYAVKLDGDGNTLRPTVSVGLALGQHF